MSRPSNDRSAARRPHPIPTPPTDPHRHAQKIADTVDEAWHRVHGTGDIEVPVSVVAALSLLAPPDGERDRVASLFLELNVDEFTWLMRTQWTVFVDARPDLVVPVSPLISVWHGDHRIDANTALAAKEVADAAIGAGQLHLTGTDRRTDTDLFGALLSTLRSRTDRNVRGLFYTPADVSDVLAGMLDVPQAGQTVHEPAAGTGGMLRAVAKAMRQHGHDPATIGWVAVDTDPLAIACLAINTVLWGLGPRVLLGVGDSLSDEWITRAAAQRRETIELADQLRGLRTMRTLLTDQEAPLNQDRPDPDTPAGP